MVQSALFLGVEMVQSARKLARRAFLFWEVAKKMSLFLGSTLGVSFLVFVLWEVECTGDR